MDPNAEEFDCDGQKKEYGEDCPGCPCITNNSTMMDSYTYNFEMDKSSGNLQGKRRAMLFKKFYDEAAEEIIRERNPPSQQSYRTEYGRNYNIAESRTTNNSTTLLHEKYPLYGSKAATFYRFSLENGVGGGLEGRSATLDKKEPFKRNSNFSTPLSQTLYEYNPKMYDNSQ